MDKLAQTLIPPGRIDLAREADFELGALRIRPSRREVEAGGARHQLQRRVMQVLVALARAGGEVVSHRELILRCWGGLSVSDDAIGRCIARLRRLAETWTEPPFEIQTIAGVGYRLIARPAAASPMTAARRAGPSRWRAWAALAGVLVLLAGAAIWGLQGRRLVSDPAPVRVAVLPFDRLSGGPVAQAFADGLLDEMLGVLSRDQVQALSRTDSVALRGPDAPRAISRLDVGLFLDGTVREEDGLVRVRAYLNDAQDHTTVWSHEFQAPAARAEALQAQVAARTTDAAHWALVARQAPTQLDPASLAAFVEAGDQLNNTGSQSEQLLRQVIVRAPDFARAHSLLAIALSDNGASDGNGGGFAGGALAARTAAARREAGRALQLDPRNGEAYLALARDTAMGAWGDREAWLAKGLAAQPDFPYLDYFQSQFLGQVGRFDEARQFAERAAALNPLFVGANANLCARLSYVGRDDQAREACGRDDRLWPGSPINEITQMYLDALAGRDRQAIARLSQPAASAFFGPAAVRTWKQFLEARASVSPTAVRAAALAAASAADAGAFDRRDAYVALALAGEVDAALRQAQLFYTAERLRRPAGPTSVDTTLFFVPATASVRRDPRFLALAARIGLVDYWRASGSWPDFCAAPGLPYDCRVEAARLVGPAVEPRAGRDRPTSGGARRHDA